MKTKVQNWTKMSICQRTGNHKKIWNVPLDALICPLQIINDIEPLSSTVHGVNVCFIHHHSNVENYSIGHKSETSQPKKKKKRVGRIYFYTSILVLDLKIKIQMAKNLYWTFWTSVKSVLNGPPNGSDVTYSKIQNRLSRPHQDTPMDRFLMQYINNKCTLILSETVKKWYSTFNGP